LKIKTLCRRACQAASKLFIPKSLLIGVAVMCACITSAQNADALGVQLQEGFGDDSGGSEWGLSFQRTDLNIFLHDGELFDLFIGGEKASSKHRPGGAEIVSSYAYEAAVLGIRVKPPERRRVNPYLIFGVLSGTVHYSVRANDPYEIISQSRTETSYMTGRAGLGLNIVFKIITLDVEANYSSGVPAAYATVVDRWGGRSDMVMFDHSAIINIAVGVHYSF